MEAEVQPQQKAETIARLRKQGRIVAMAGDGIKMLLHLRQPTLELRWVPARTWRWPAQGSFW